MSDRYQQIRKLGQGGMGEVWLVHDRELGANFAMKRILPSLVRSKDWNRFEREINHLQKLCHPNIVRIKDANLHVDAPFYIMEYCSGGSIGNLKNEAKGNYILVENVFRQTMQAIACLQNINPVIVHRDIKPLNILIGDDGNFKLADFGLSISSDDTTVTSSAWGSFGFTAPEQFTNMHDVDTRADIYSIGAVAFYLFTGDVPTGKNYQSLRGFKNPVIGNLHYLLEPSPFDRPATAREVLLGIDRMRFSANSTGEYLDYAEIARCPICRSWAIEEGQLDPAGFSSRTTCLVCEYAQPPQL